MFNISLEAYEPRGEAPVDFSKKQKKKKKGLHCPVTVFQLDRIRSQLQG